MERWNETSHGELRTHPPPPLAPFWGWGCWVSSQLTIRGLIQPTTLYRCLFFKPQQFYNKLPRKSKTNFVKLTQTLDIVLKIFLPADNLSFKVDTCHGLDSLVSSVISESAHCDRSFFSGADRCTDRHTLMF